MNDFSQVQFKESKLHLLYLLRNWVSHTNLELGNLKLASLVGQGKKRLWTLATVAYNGGGWIPPFFYFDFKLKPQI
jgi:hypothetical protein